MPNKDAELEDETYDVVGGEDNNEVQPTKENDKRLSKTPSLEPIQEGVEN